MHDDLALVYDYLGRHADAIREAKAAAAAPPDGPSAEWYTRYVLSYLYARAGETDRAIDMLKDLLENPSGLSRDLLRVTPIWGFLRGNPRFEQLLAQPSPGERPAS